MKYLILLVIILAAWGLLGEFVFKDRDSEGITSLADKFRDLGRRLHLVAGLLAALILGILLLRLVFHTLWPQQ